MYREWPWSLPDDGDVSEHHYRKRGRIPATIEYTPTWRTGGVGGVDDIFLATQQSHAADPGSGGAQDPNKITWIPRRNWDLAWWDKTPMDPINTPLNELRDFIFPSPYTMRGLNQRFYEIRPFEDNTAPTVAEIDSWNVEVIKLFRDLVGNPTPVFPDHCLFLRAQWALERHFTDAWDADYSFTGVGSLEGPCFLFGERHPGYPRCGFDFIPGDSHQWDYGWDYLCPNTPSETTLGSAETLPWSIKLSTVILQFIEMYISSNGAVTDVVKLQQAQKVGLAWNINEDVVDDVIFKFSD